MLTNIRTDAPHVENISWTIVHIDYEKRVAHARQRDQDSGEFVGPTYEFLYRPGDFYPSVGHKYHRDWLFLRDHKLLASTRDVSMDVFIVSRGESCEGGTVTGVYSTHGAAVQAALASLACWPESGWNPEGDDRWTNGCDYVTVEKFKVIE